jgi:hypothetical protein
MQDVASPRVHSVADALAAYSAPELLDEFRDGRGAAALGVQKTLCLDTAPRVLLLHLKLFRYAASGAPRGAAGSARVKVR